MIEKDLNAIRHLRTLTSDEVDTDGVKEFICKLYGYSENNINECRYKDFLKFRFCSASDIPAHSDSLGIENEMSEDAWSDDSDTDDV
ncbi:hypothetical protein Pcinc_032207 [Petrolisthes cinctipes]|uniref:Uncharacterized protein n=1 Tax=Petrolisthes cinctipes TaxID=88211 RepID=A0AAE1K3Q7_PETCI|nr:hypothetical protein Pcinc_032207 [Petrolisthes cinctipes]